MALNEAIIIVVTINVDFFNSVKGWLVNAAVSRHVVHVQNLLDIERNIVKGKCNVILLDVDFGSLNEKYFSSLMEKHKLHIILTGKTTTAAVPLVRAGIKDFVLKPPDKFAHSSYVDFIKKRIMLFVNEDSLLNYTLAPKTVDINEKIVVIGSSTGGTNALEVILPKLPANSPPVLIVQHIISGFTKFFADRLNGLCKVEVREAQNNDFLQKGLVLIAPADMHMILVRRNQRLQVECFKGTKVNCVMPSADVLFESVEKVMHKNAVGVILTGMGSDGARGLLKMRTGGCKTIGQDQNSCVVYGMPKVAFDIGAVEKQVSLDNMADAIIAAYR